MRKLLFAGMVVAATVALAPSAQAANIPYTTDGSWQNAQPALCCTITNGSPTNSVRWGQDNSDNSGVPAANPSGYDFTEIVAPGGVAVTDGTPFVLGTFNHLNFPVFQPWLASVDLAFTLNLTGAVPGSVNGLFTFTHEETPNQTPCAYGATNGPCDDRVLVSTPSVDLNFTVGGVPYYFNLIGFSTDMGTTITNQFTTAEGQQNPATLYGRITETPQIPEPASLILLGSGLLGAARLRRRK